MKWNRALMAAFAVFAALMLTTIAPAVRADEGENATITTDKPDYHPEETVIINGTAFLADTTVTVGVTRPDGNYSAWNVTSDGSGAFSTSYQLDGITGTYDVSATDGTNTATTTFTDSAANLDQCTNGGVGDPLESCQGNNWVNGNANGQKAHWKEGEFISYRVTISGLTSGSHTLQGKYDTVHGGKHAMDYLGSFDATETTGAANANHANANDPCSDVLTSGCTPSAPTDTFPIPSATLVNCGGSVGTVPSQIPGDVAIFGTGADLTGMSYVLQNDPQGGGQCSTTFSVTFSVPSGTTKVVLAWGGHISSQFDWGTGNSATYITGSPFHMSLVSFDGGSTGSQDRALAAGAIIKTFLIVIKHVINDDGGTAVAGDFTMLVSGVNPQASSFPGMESPGVTITIDAGAFSVTETGPGGYSSSLSGCSGTIVAGTNKTCTITNDDSTTHLTLVKVVVNNNGGTAVPTDWTLYGAGPTPISGAGGVSSDVLPGTYTLTESSGPSGYTASSWSCVGGSQSSNTITLTLGQTATCTITNDDQAAHLKLVKVVVNDNGGTAQPSAWTLSAAGPTPISGAGGAESDVNAGTYTLTESGGPSGYAASSWTCVGGSQSTNHVTLGPGQSATCTITNDDITAHLTLVKVVVNDNGGSAVTTDFTLSAAGPTPLSGAGGAESDVDAGTYTLTEAGPPGYAGSAWTCVGGTQSTNHVTLGPGQSATCTITNDDITAQLTLVKVVVNDNGGARVTTEWTLSAAGPTPLSGAGGASGNVNAGTYTLSEAGPSDYTASDWSCVGGSQSANEVTLALGESATCTITNDDKAPSLTLIKYVVNDNGGSAVATDWTLTASGPTPISGAGGATSGAGFSAGTYTLTESAGPSGYAASAWTCVGGSQTNDQITLGLGQTATCTITNNDVQPKLIVIKHVVNDNGGLAVAGDFTMTVAGNSPSPSSFGGAESPGTNVAINAGGYSVTESSLFGYTQTSAVGCSGTISVGETKTCTITNDDVAPKLIVIKHVVNDNGGTATAASFTMTVTATNVQPSASFAGAESPGTTVTLNQGSFSVSEGSVFGYTQTSAVGCSGTISVGETKTCTITNDDVAPKLIVIKHVVNDNGGGASAAAFTMTVTATNVQPSASFPGAESPGTTVTLNQGSFSVSESSLSGYTQTSAVGCSGSISVGQTKTCTITNDDVAPSLTLVKVVVNNNGGTAVYTDWTLTASGPTPISGAGGATSGPSFSTGTYTLSESAGPSGYAASQWVCTGTGTQVGNQIILGLGQSAVCTITNNDKAPHLTLIKTVVNGETGTALPTAWTLTASGPTPISGAGGATSGAGFSAGTYTLSESTGPAGYAASGWSCSGDGTQVGNQITLGLGDSATCGITNTRQSAIKVLKHTFPSGEQQSFQFTMLGVPGFQSGLNFPLSDGQSFTTGFLPPGSYSVSENPTSGWALMSASCDHGQTPGQIQLLAGQLVTCTFNNTHSGFVTDSALCAFDRDANRAGQQFRLLLTQDPASPAYYKVTATNPGQFFYNIIVDDEGVPTTHTVTLTFPYPFVTQGAVPIHVYDTVSFVTQNGLQCLVPGNPYFTSTQQVTLASYGGGSFGSYTTLTITFTSNGFGYLNVHMDYGLKETTGWSKGGVSGNDAIGSGPYSGVTIYDLGTYTFSFSVSGDGSGTSDIQNENAFKKDPGFAGLVTNSAGNAVAGVQVKIFNPDGSLLATVYTDADGVYAYTYKYTGKGATFTISLPFYGQSKQVYVKSNSFVWVNFQVP